MIQFIKNIFRSPPEPVTVFRNEVLGEFKYNSDDEGWEFSYNGVRILIAYEWEPEPKNDLIMYCLQVLKDLDGYRDAIERAKEVYVKKYPEYGDEVQRLKIIEISFDRENDQPWFMVSLGTGCDCREWRTEFTGMSYDCQIAFDS